MKPTRRMPTPVEDTTPRQPANDRKATNPNTFLVSTRAALILALALICGATVGTLTWWAGHPAAEVVLAALATTGASLPVLHTTIGP